MRVAVLGATSEIAKDLIVSLSAEKTLNVVLFARRPEAVVAWLADKQLDSYCKVADFSTFEIQKFDGVMNFVGVGNPARIVTMGKSIFDVTLRFDQMVLDYLHRYPDCRYLFMSSGAAYGSGFDVPADQNTKAVVAINRLDPQDWYGIAKLHAESRHRALPHLPIVDIRIFNYFSHNQDISARFLSTDILRAIRSGDTLVTSSENIVRDYIGPHDFHQLISLILTTPPTNDVVDCYTKAPVDKFTLLEAVKNEFNFSFKVTDDIIGLSATGMKKNYFSRNTKAQRFGYKPQFTALATVLGELSKAAYKNYQAVR